MSENQEPGAGPTKRNTGHKFWPGHPRYGGKKRNTAAAARAMAEEMGVDPLEFLLNLVRSEFITETVIADGKKKRVEVHVPIELRADCAKTVMNYMYPRLTAQTITTPNDAPVQVVGFNLTELMKDPAMVEAAQTLALGMAETPQISAPENLEPNRAYDYATDLETDANGHWRKR